MDKFLGKRVPAYSGAESLSRDLNIPVVFSKINRIKRGYYNVEFKVISNFPKNTKKNMITNTYTNYRRKLFHSELINKLPINIIHHIAHKDYAIYCKPFQNFFNWSFKYLILYYLF